MDDGYVYNSTDYHNLYPTLLSPPILETSGTTLHVYIDKYNNNNKKINSFFMCSSR